MDTLPDTYAIEDGRLEALLPPPPDPGLLAPLEWQRLAWFAATQGHHIEYPVRLAFTDSERFEHLTTSWCTVMQKVLVGWTGLGARDREQQWLWLRSYAPDPHGVWLLRLLRDSVTDFVRAANAPERSACACFADTVRWRRFATWWIYQAQTGRLQNFLAGLSKQLPDSVKVDLAVYRTRKQAGSGGYG